MSEPRYENADILPHLPMWLVNFECRVMYRRNERIEDLAILEHSLRCYLRDVDEFRANPNHPLNAPGWFGWTPPQPPPMPEFPASKE